MKKYKLAAALLACLLASAPFAATQVRAQSGNYSQLIESVQIKKYLVLKKNVPVPNVTFRYTLSPGRAVAETDSTYEIKPGPSGAVFASSQNTVSFTKDDAVTPEASAASGSTIRFATQDNTSDEVFVEKSITVDLRGVTFPDEGIYRYVVTEEASTSTGIVSDPVRTRYIDVFVQKSDRTDDDTFDPGTAIIRINDGAPDSEGKTSASVKSTGFTSRYDTYKLSFSKNITGNQASANQFFKFTVKLTGNITSDSGDNPIKVTGNFDPQPYESMATIYDADVMKAANDIAGYASLSQFKPENGGKDFYIRGGEKVELTGIPAGLGYEVTEVKDDYPPSVEVTGDPDCTQEASEEIFTITDEALTKDTELVLLNTRNGIIPTTGITSAFTIPAAALFAGITGMVLLAAKRLRRNKKETSEGNGIE